jgi:hypothetical protein
MTSPADTPSPPSPAEGRKPPGRRAWLLWVLGGAFLGAAVGLYLVPGSEGFYDGALVGGVIELLLVLAINALFGGRQGTLLVSGVTVACGLAIGALASLLLRPHDASLNLVMLGLVVGVVDGIVAWVLFPPGTDQPPAAGEELSAEDDFSDS